MTESATTFTKFELGECKNQEATASNLLGDTMVCKASSDSLRSQSTTGEACFLPSGSDLLAQLSEAPGGVCEKRGPVSVDVDGNGQLVEVNDSRGNTFTKNADGTWTERYSSGNTETVENVDVDREGNLSFDYNDDRRNVHSHHEFRADGSYSFTDELGRRDSYDRDGNLVEAPAGNGFERRFHYTNGQLDQIDGRLGHWDRVEKDGQISWVNKDTGAAWQGDFTLDSEGNLEYKGERGGDWEFTISGTDVDKTKRNN